MLSGKRCGFFSPPLVVFSQSQGLGRGRGSGGVIVDPGMREQEGCTRDISIPVGMVVRGGRRQSICQPALHMSQRGIFSSSKGL